MDLLLYVSIALSAATVLLLIAVLRRTTRQDLTAVHADLQSLRTEHGRVEARLRDDLHRQGSDATAAARALREEVGMSVKQAGDSIVHSVGEISHAQRAQLEAFAAQLAQLRTELTAALEAMVDGTVP